MELNLQNSNLNISSISTNSLIKYDSVNLVFSFDAQVLPNALENFTDEIKIPNLANLKDTGSIHTLHNSTNNNFFIIVSLGIKEEFNFKKYIDALRCAVNFINKNSKIEALNIIIEESISKNLNLDFNYYVEQTVFHFINNLYYFDELKSKRKTLSLSKVNFVSSCNVEPQIKSALDLIQGLFLSKNLANNPANIATPTYLAQAALNFANLSSKVKVKVLNKDEVQQLQMNAFLAVAQGSVAEPKLIVIEYNGTNNSSEPIALVGKGITFDAGGISLKPSLNMDQMKYDMCGAATVLGIFDSVIRLGLPINLIGVIPCCENLPSGNAVKPGDIVKTMSGQSVEILNTDAEGRLILADGLTYAIQNYKPKFIIDIATLTGAVVVALGNLFTGLYSNDPELTQKLINSGIKTNDFVWELPLPEQYNDSLKSEVADLKNIGSWKGVAGSITAACFLSKFVENYKWVHLDIAGSAWNNSMADGDSSGSTGRPFFMLIDFLRSL